MLESAMRPVPVIMIGGVMPSSPQANANRAWQRLGEAHNVDWMSIRPFGPDAIPYEYTGEELPPKPEPERHITIDLRTGLWISYPEGGINAGEGARVASSMMPGWPAEAIDAAYDEYMSFDEVKS